MLSANLGVLLIKSFGYYTGTVLQCTIMRSLSISLGPNCNVAFEKGGLVVIKEVATKPSLLKVTVH